MTDILTLSLIRTFLATEASSGATNAIQDRATELLRIFDALSFTQFQIDYAAANNGEKLRLLGELQSALLSGRTTQ